MTCPQCHNERTSMEPYESSDASAGHRESGVVLRCHDCGAESFDEEIAEPPCPECHEQDCQCPPVEMNWHAATLAAERSLRQAREAATAGARDLNLGAALYQVQQAIAQAQRARVVGEAE